MINKLKHIMLISVTLLTFFFLFGCQNQTDITFRILYQSDYEEAPKRINVLANYQLQQKDLPILTNDYFIFDGWYDGTKLVKVGDSVTKHLTLKAKWHTKNYTISYDTGIGPKVEPTTIWIKDATLSRTHLPFIEANGYNFDGWYIGTKKIDVGYKISSDVTLTAQWISVDAQLVKAVKDALVIADSVEESINKIKLPLVSEKAGVNISWASSDESIISNDGSVTHVIKGGDKKVILTAIFSRGVATDTKKFQVIVHNPTKTDDEKAVEYEVSSFNLAKTIVEENENKIELPLETSHGVRISWSSNNSNILNSSGDVTHTIKAGEQKVVLTAVFTKGDATGSKTIEITVKNPSRTPEEIADDNKVFAAKIDLRLETVVDEKVEQITLPSESVGVKVIWSSNKKNIIDDTGKVTHTVRAGDQEVLLTATLTFGTASDTKTFIMTVKNPIKSAEEIAAEIKANKSAIAEAMNNIVLPTSVEIEINKIELPTSSGEVTISWTSNDLNVINQTGEVSHKVNAGEQNIIMTGTFCKGDQKENKEYIVVVKNKEDLFLLIDDAFGDNIQWGNEKLQIYITNTDVQNDKMSFIFNANTTSARFLNYTYKVVKENSVVIIKLSYDGVDANFPTDLSNYKTFDLSYYSRVKDTISLSVPIWQEDGTIKNEKADFIKNKIIELPSMTTSQILDYKYVWTNGYRLHLTDDNIKDLGLTQGLGLLTDLCKKPFIEQIIIDDGKTTSFPNEAFTGCEYLEVVKFPKNILNIGNYTFFKNKALKIVELPEHLVDIGECTFSECSSLENIQLPITTKNIGFSAFSECSSLKSLEIPSLVDYLPDNLVSNCLNLETITINGKLKSMGANMLGQRKENQSQKLTTIYYYGGTIEEWNSVFGNRLIPKNTKVVCIRP